MSPAGAGVRLDVYLAAAYRHSSVETWGRRADAGAIDVDGRPADPATALRPGAIVTWRREPWDEPDVPLAFGIAFEDEWLVAVDKPSGLPTMPAGGFLDHTLLALVHARWSGAIPLHRLGRHTSGLVLFARDRATASRLARAWREHRVRKIYRALVEGQPAWDALRIDAPIGPVPHARLGTVHAASPTGRPSSSVARVLERRESSSLAEVEIVTGRPHQVRIHLAWAGHPLAGDPLYVAGGGPRADDPGLPGDGGYLLHAARLELAHPVTGETLGIQSLPPAELRAASEGGRPDREA